MQMIHNYISHSASQLLSSSWLLHMKHLVILKQQRKKTLIK